MTAPVGGHKDLDVASRVKPIQLVDEFQHGSLDFIGAPVPIGEPSAFA